MPPQMSVLGVATAPDLLRLLAIPLFAWVAILDVKTRRVPSAVWIPLGMLGALLVVWDGWVAYSAGVAAWEAFLIPTALSLGVLVPLAYCFWWFGGFGGADAKAIMVIALVFPVLPTYTVAGVTMPIAGGEPLSPFSLSILVNGLLIALVIPVVLVLTNAAAGRLTPVMAIGWPVPVERIPRTHGRLLETDTGPTFGGLDLDALRMYCRWRGTTLEELRRDPDRLRDPESLPEEPYPPTDGAVYASTGVTDGGHSAAADHTAADDRDSIGGKTESVTAIDDPWGAAAFLDAIEGSAYGTTPADLREGLDVLVREETVWISPGTPFLVPIFAGLVLAVGYGDVLVTLVL